MRARQAPTTLVDSGGMLMVSCRDGVFALTPVCAGVARDQLRAACRRCLAWARLLVARVAESVSGGQELWPQRALVQRGGGEDSQMRAASSVIARTIAHEGETGRRGMRCLPSATEEERGFGSPLGSEVTSESPLGSGLCGGQMVQAPRVINMGCGGDRGRGGGSERQLRLKEQ